MNTQSNATTVPIELLRKYDRPGPRYTSYPTAPTWSDDIGPEAYEEALQAASVNKDDLLALYCHIPFCKQRCFYCGCNTCITTKPESSQTYIDALDIEITRTASNLGQRNKVSLFHFGGGTPTYVGVSGLKRVMDIFEKHFDFVPGHEKSIEVDPRVTTREHLDYLRTRGFNRVSVGVQDFNHDVQVAVGRVQSEEQILKILTDARDLNYKGINFDLIYGLPHQTVESFGKTLDKTIELRPERLAVYSFAYLPSVKAHQLKINKEDLPTTEVKYELFALAVEKFTAAGYRQIGMDHFALPEDELSIAQADGRLYRNFMGYSIQSAPEMVGIGMSSIGYINNGFYQNISKIGSYKTAIADQGFAVYRGMRLSEDDLIRQYLITELMCNFHLSFDALKERFGVSYHDYFKDENAQLGDFKDDKFLRETEEGLEITPLGRTFVRNIAMTFDAYLNGKKKGTKATFSRTI